MAFAPQTFGTENLGFKALTSWFLSFQGLGPLEQASGDAVPIPKSTIHGSVNIPYTSMGYFGMCEDWDAQHWSFSESIVFCEVPVQPIRMCSVLTACQVHGGPASYSNLVA